MNLETFQECLDLYGADLERWPPALRRQAAHALQNSTPLQNRLEEERLFEARLFSAEVPAPSGDLAGRIAMAAKGIEQKRTRAWWTELFSPRPALAFVSLLLLGFMLGIWAGAWETRRTTSTDLASLYNDGETSWINQLNSSY